MFTGMEPIHMMKRERQRIRSAKKWCKMPWRVLKHGNVLIVFVYW